MLGVVGGGWGWLELVGVGLGVVGGIGVVVCLENWLFVWNRLCWIGLWLSMFECLDVWISVCGWVYCTCSDPLHVTTALFSVLCSLRSYLEG